jgi:hypothetical protein
MAHRRALTRAATVLALAACAPALAGANAADAATATSVTALPTARSAHPWLLELAALPGRPTADGSTPLPAIGWLDAADLSVGLQADPARGSLAANLSARYRLDAAAHLAAKRADAEDLLLAAEATLERDRRDARLSAFAIRCEGLWRAWQRALLEHGLDHVDVPAERAYLEALLALLASSPAPPSGTSGLGACALESWVPEVPFVIDAPVALAAAAEGRLAARARAVPEAAPAASAWFDLELGVGVDAPFRVAVRAGLELPFATPTGGGALTLGVDGLGPDVGLRWAPERVDDRIVRQHRRALGLIAAPDPDAERRARFERRALEADLARADAERRWTASCGDTHPDVLLRCLASALDEPGPPREDLLTAIDVELGAVHAFLALVEAGGADLVTLLSARGRGAPEPRPAAP